MHKLYLSTIFIFLLSLVSLSQMKIDKNTPITNGESVYIKYHNVNITPPKGYYFLEKYSSFVNVKNNTTVSVAKKKGISYKQMVSNFLDKNSKLDKAKMVSHEALGEGTFFIFEFKIQGITTQRMMYLIGDEDGVYYAMANYKLEDKLDCFDSLKKTVLSLKL